MFWYSNSADHKWNGSLINSLPHCFSVISKLWDTVSADIAESFIHVSGVAYYGFLFPWKFCRVSSCRWESLFPNNLDPRYRSFLGRSVGNWGSINWNQLFKTKHIFLTVFQSKCSATLESRKLFSFGVRNLRYGMWQFGELLHTFPTGKKNRRHLKELRCSSGGGSLMFFPSTVKKYLKNLQRF